MSKKKRKSYSREFKLEAVGLITEKGYSIAEASRNLGIEYSNEPLRISTRISYEDSRKKRYVNKIDHNLEIYKEIGTIRIRESRA